MVDGAAHTSGEKGLPFLLAPKQNKAKGGMREEGREKRERERKGLLPFRKKEGGREGEKREEEKAGPGVVIVDVDVIVALLLLVVGADAGGGVVGVVVR